MLASPLLQPLLLHLLVLLRATLRTLLLRLQYPSILLGYTVILRRLHPAFLMHTVTTLLTATYIHMDLMHTHDPQTTSILPIPPEILLSHSRLFRRQVLLFVSKSHSKYFVLDMISPTRIRKSWQSLSTGQVITSS